MVVSFEAVAVGRGRLDWREAACLVLCLVLVGGLVGVGKCAAMMCLGLLLAAHDTFGGLMAVRRLFFVAVVGVVYLHLPPLSLGGGVVGHPRRSYLFLVVGAAPCRSAFSFAQVVPAPFAF